MEILWKHNGFDSKAQISRIQIVVFLIFKKEKTSRK